MATASPVVVIRGNYSPALQGKVAAPGPRFVELSSMP
jgi:hypothetical protein